MLIDTSGFFSLHDKAEKHFEQEGFIRLLK